MPKKENKTRMVPISKLRPGPIQHETLSDDLQARIKILWEKTRWVYPTNLEQFELGFMRDTNPESEVVIWECMAEAYENICSGFKFTPTKEQRDQIFKSILGMTVGTITKDEILKDESLLYIAAEYVAAKNKRGLE